MKGETLVGVLTEEQMDWLKDGETLEFLVEKREPLTEGAEPTSMNVLEVELYTKGVIGDRSLEEEYPDVIGLSDEENYD